MKRAFQAALVLAFAALPGVAAAQFQNASDHGATAAAPADGKIAITTSSDEARALFLKGRDLNDKLRAQDARPILDQAIAADPSFALAYYVRALAAAGNDDFFANLDQAVAHAGQASEGERLLIEGTAANVRAEPDKALASLERLVELFPDDERAHFALGGIWFGRQKYDQAIAEFQRAIEIAPDYSPPYNQLGYAARAAGQFDVAEDAFKRYVALLPNEPNPHDSYAEFLMKRGRFDESIEQYRAALAADPSFNFSYVGIANDQTFMGQGDAARATLQQMYDGAPNYNVQRTALLWKAASYLHEGNRDAAIQTLTEMRGLAERNDDWLAASGDDQTMGDAYLGTGDPDAAAEKYASALEAGQKSDAPQGIKDAIARNDAYNRARVALAKGDVAAARKVADEYHRLVTAKNVPFELRQDHELMGRIALAEGDFDAALAHLGQASQQDPRVLLAIAQAHEGKGDDAAMRQAAKAAADFNQLNFNYSFVRGSAREMLDQG